MNIEYSYSFIIQNKSFNLITKNNKLYLIAVYGKQLNIIKNVDNLLNVFIPQTYNSSLKEILDKKFQINSDYRFKGIVLKSEGYYTKIRNTSHDYFKYIFKDNTLQKIFDFFYLKKEEFIVKYNIDLYTTIKKKFFDLTYYIYIGYRNIYIRKCVDINNFDKNIQNIIKEIHYDYINILMPKKKYVTKSYVIEKINKFSVYKRFNMVANLTYFYKLLNKFRI